MSDVTERARINGENVRNIHPPRPHQNDRRRRQK